MQNTVHDVKEINQMFFDYFQSSISISLIVFVLYLLVCAIFICHYSLKGIIFSFLLVLIAYIIYLLVYDITYVQYLMSLHLDESFRMLFNYYFPLFTLAKHAPSKALPKIEKIQVYLLKILWKSSFVMMTYYRYSLYIQKRLLYLSRIYILILDLPVRKYNLLSNKLKSKIKMN